MVAPATVPGIHQSGTHAARPAATTVSEGALYACSTHGLVYYSNGATWSTWATLGGGSGGGSSSSGVGDKLYLNANFR